MGHQSPSTSATHNIQDRIKNIAITPTPWSSTRALPLRQQWRNQRPLSIIQIGRVGLSGHAFKSTRPFSKHSLKGFLAHHPFEQGIIKRSEPAKTKRGNISFLTHNYLTLDLGLKPRRRFALPTTVTDENAIAAPAISGLSNNPKNGNSTPIATGMPSTL